MSSISTIEALPTSSRHRGSGLAMLDAPGAMIIGGACSLLVVRLVAAIAKHSEIRSIRQQHFSDSARAKQQFSITPWLRRQVDRVPIRLRVGLMRTCQPHAFAPSLSPHLTDATSFDSPTFLHSGCSLGAHGPDAYRCADALCRQYRECRERFWRAVLASTTGEQFRRGGRVAWQ